jgi:hypothetical protein
MEGGITRLLGETMRVILCEQCGTPLPWTARYCAACGTAVSLHPVISNIPDAQDQSTNQPHVDSFQSYSFYKMPAVNDPDETQRLDHPRSSVGLDDPDETQRLNHTRVRITSGHLPAAPAVDATSHILLEDWLNDEDMDDETVLSRSDTWQKFVTRKTPVTGVGVVRAVAPSTPVPPITPLPPPYSREIDLTPEPGYKKWPPRYWFMPRVTGWISIVIIIAMFLAGGFGVYVSLGRNTATKPSTPISGRKSRPATRRE